MEGEERSGRGDGEGGRGKRGEESPVGTGVVIMPPRVARQETLHTNDLAVSLRCNTLH